MRYREARGCLPRIWRGAIRHLRRLWQASPRKCKRLGCRRERAQLDRSFPHAAENQAPFQRERRGLDLARKANGTRVGIKRRKKAPGIVLNRVPKIVSNRVSNMIPKNASVGASFHS